MIQKDKLSSEVVPEIVNDIFQQEMGFKYGYVGLPSKECINVTIVWILSITLNRSCNQR